MSGLRVAGMCWVVLAPALAVAGQRPFTWAYDTTIVSSGNIEMEQWLWIEGPVASNPATGSPHQPSIYWLWWAPVVGVTRHLEVAVPFQALERAGTTALTSFDADLRWRLFPQDDRSGFQALLRTAWHQSLSPREYLNPSRFDFNLSTSYGAPDEIHLVAELGGQVGVPISSAGAVDSPLFAGTYDVGAVYPFLSGALQVGAELYGEKNFVPLDPDSGLSNSGFMLPHHWAGATVAWTGGRYWATLGFLMSLSSWSTTPQFLTRLIWAVSL